MRKSDLIQPRVIFAFVFVGGQSHAERHAAVGGDRYIGNDYAAVFVAVSASCARASSLIEKYVVLRRYALVLRTEDADSVAEIGVCAQSGGVRVA